MIPNNREIVFNGGPFQSYWWADEHDPAHLAIMAEICKDIDYILLQQAWEDTKQVYPLIDLIPDDYDEEVLFFKSEGESEPIKSKTALQLVKEVTLYRGVSLTFFENTVKLNAYHSIVDEKGLNEIFKTLLNFYFSYVTNTCKDDSYVMTKTERNPEEYFIQNTMLSPSDYISQNVTLYNDVREVFNDTNAVNDESNAITVGMVDIQSDKYDELCKNYDVSAEVMLIYVMARTIYRMYPAERRRISFGIMTDFRSAFEVEENIAPCSKKMPLVLSYDEVCSADMNDALQNILKQREYQKSDDYIKTQVALENTYSVLNIRNAGVSVNFCGEFDIGKKTSYVKNIMMTDYSVKSVFMMRLNDTIKVSFQYGNATSEYMNNFKDVLNELNMKSEIAVNAYGIPTESEVPVI